MQPQTQIYSIVVAKKKLCFQVHPIVNASIYATCLTEPPLQQHFFNLVANVRSEIPMVLMAPAIL
jgi:hypothetical protein